MLAKGGTKVVVLALVGACFAVGAVYLMGLPAGKVVGGKAAGDKVAGMAGLLQPHAVGAMAGFMPQETRVEAPDASFIDGQGRERRLDAWRGKVVLVNLWATWCGPCREEMPALDRLQAALGGDDFEVVAISIDRGGPEGPAAFLAEVGAQNLALYNDATGRIATQFGVFGMPTTILIDRDGAILGRLVGPAEWDAEDAQALIGAALAS